MTPYITCGLTVLGVLKEWTDWSRFLQFATMKSGTLCLLSRGLVMISNWTHYDGGDIDILHPGAENEVALFSLSLRACSVASCLLPPKYTRSCEHMC